MLSAIEMLHDIALYKFNIHIHMHMHIHWKTNTHRKKTIGANVSQSRGKRCSNFQVLHKLICHAVPDNDMLILHGIDGYSFVGLAAELACVCMPLEVKAGFPANATNVRNVMDVRIASSSQ